MIDMLDTHARKYVQPVIRHTAKGFLRLGLGVNQVTWIAFILGLFARFLVYLGFSVVAVIISRRCR